MKTSPIQYFWHVLVLWLIVFVYGYPAHADTLEVPSEFATIQSAVNAAIDGDTILVAPGTYYENVIVDRTAIHLRSEAGAEHTIIDGSNVGQVVTIVAVSSFIMDGFTIQKGNPGTSLWPAGIWIMSGLDITIRNNIVRDNSCSSCVGVGIGITGPVHGLVLIEDNVFENNYAPGCGGAIGVSTLLNLEIANNLIQNNHCNVGGGIYIRSGSRNNIIKNNEIKNNSATLYGGGIWAQGTPINVTQNVITGNTAQNGGGVYTDVDNLSANTTTSFTNNTIANNLSEFGSEIHLRGESLSSHTIILTNNSISNDVGFTSFFCDLYEPPVLLLTSNNVYSSSGSAYGGSCNDIYTGVNGNISEEAMYYDAINGNFRLSLNSPLIDAGDSTAANLPSKDIDGLPRIIDGDGDGVEVVDIGAYEFQRHAISVVIDIKPNNKSNIINPSARGGVWVTIVSDSGFDPLQIDTSTVRFGPNEAEATRHRVKDVDKDGLADLLLRFKVPETGIVCGDTEATLTGETFDGQSFTGTDSVKTVGCNKVGNKKNKSN